MTELDSLPFSQAAENNGQPILQELERLLADCHRVVEIGSGTGQHAVRFATALPQLHWQPTEHPNVLGTLRLRCDALGPANLEPPVALDLAERPWPIDWPDAIYTANTFHIISTDLVERFFAACSEQAPGGSKLFVYGPFNYNGSYTSESNARFDEWLKDRDERSAIRDFEWVDELARSAGYVLVEDIAMPANNRLLCWERAA